MSEDEPISGRVMTTGETPRSYVVETDLGELHRNRRQLIVAPEQESDSTPETVAEPEQSPESQTPPRRIMTRTHTGTQIQPPDRLA